MATVTATIAKLLIFLIVLLGACGLIAAQVIKDVYAMKEQKKAPQLDQATDA